MQELQELFDLATSIKSSLPRVPSSSSNGNGGGGHDKNYRQALLSVRSAVDLSRGYVARLRAGQAPKLAHGTQALRYAWSTASVELFPFDGELSRRCMLKGFYWSDPDSWSQDEVENAAIALDEARATVQELLSASGSLMGTGEETRWREKTVA